MRIEVAVAFEQIDEVVRAITAAANINPIDGGAIYVTPIEQAVRAYTEFAVPV